MAKLKYKEGSEWKQIAPSKKEFDDLRDEVIEGKEDYAKQRATDNLKVATVEKGLNDYKSTLANVNVNQEVKQKVTGHGTISLPKNTANGQVSVSIKGNTEGTKSTISASRLKSVGKNLFDWKKSVRQGIATSYVEFEGRKCLKAIQQSNFFRYTMSFKPNTQYAIKFDVKTVITGSAPAFVLFVDYSDGTSETIISRNPANTTWKTVTGVTEANKTVTGFRTATYDIYSTAYMDIDTFQIVEGTIATPYEPYTESTSYLPNVGELRSLPNGVCDEIRIG